MFRPLIAIALSSLCCGGLSPAQTRVTAKKEKAITVEMRKLHSKDCGGQRRIHMEMESYSEPTKKSTIYFPLAKLVIPAGSITPTGSHPRYGAHTHLTSGYNLIGGYCRTYLGHLSDYNSETTHKPKIAAEHKFFRFLMKIRIGRGREPDAKNGIMCPKVSWTVKNVFFFGLFPSGSCYAPEDGEFSQEGSDKVEIPKQDECHIGYHMKASCYSIAGLNRDALVPCWKDEDGQWLYLPDNTDGRGPERMGCKSISPKKLKPGTEVEFEFITNRLGYFRLLPASDYERARVRDWRKPGSTFVSADGVCEVVPESNRWAFRFGKDDTVLGRLICRGDDDCRKEQRCEFLEGCRPDLGLCKEKSPEGEEFKTQEQSQDQE